MKLALRSVFTVPNRWMAFSVCFLIVWQIGCKPPTPPPQNPSVTISASPTAIAVGQSTTLTWSSTNATSCTASGAWSGSEPISGSASITPANSGNLRFTLTCTGNANATASAFVMLTVNAPIALSFANIPSISVSLGTKIPAVDILQFVQGGSPPFTYSVVAQTTPTAIDCSVSGSTLSSDYAYAGGINTVTVQVADSKQATASTTVSVMVNVPTVADPVDGSDFSPYERGQSPSSGTIISLDQLTERVGIIAPYTKKIRGYSSTMGQENLGLVGHHFGLQVCMGASITADPAANAMEMTNLIAHAKNGEADCAVIGTEALFQNLVSPTQLTGYIDQFRAAVPNVPVATADTYEMLLDTPQVVDDCDFVFANYYPYWEGKDISVAMAHLNAEDALLRKTYPTKEVIVSESGWPSGGDTVGNGVPSLANAASYFLNFESWVKAGNRKAFYFEAFDEVWKATPTAPQQGTFGIFDEDGNLKYGSDVFAGATMPDNWTCTTAPGGSGTPSITLTSVPPIGSSNLLQGGVSHVVLGNYYVVTYIHVGSSGWWVKPLAVAPLTLIDCDGTWSANIVTGGNDASADEITAFLVPTTYSPPILTGAATLPTDLYTNSVANVSVNRP